MRVDPSFEFPENDIDSFDELRKDDKIFLAAWIVFWILLAGLFIIPAASAVEINPSINDRPFFCKMGIKELCDIQKPTAGPTGPQGEKGESNFSALYFNSSNFTSYQTNASFFNTSGSLTFSSNITSFNNTVGNVTANSNYTYFYGATVYNVTSSGINESYAYLPGRAGGQVLTGGTGANDDLILNGTSSETKTTSYVVLQPDEGYVGVGVLNPRTPLQINSTVLPEISFGRTAGNPNQYGYIGFGGYPTISDGALILSSNREINSGTYSNSDKAGNDYRLVSSSGLSYFLWRGTNTNGGIPSELARLTGSGLFSVGGITSPTAQFHTTGTVRFANYGAGTATFDSGGNITSVSDSKVKTNIATYPAGLAQVLQLSPKQYKYSPDSGLDTQNVYVGFIAQDVEKVLPGAVKSKDDVKYEQKLKTKGATQDEDEYETIEVKTGTQTKSLDDRAIIAALVNAVKEQQEQIDAQQKQIDDLTARITKLEAIKG